MPLHHNLNAVYLSLLTLPGLHYLLTRYGNRTIKKDAFNQAFRERDWDEHGFYPELRVAVENYAQRGRILELGCGTGKLAKAINPERFSQYIGVDISSTAIEEASQDAIAGSKKEFIQADLTQFRPEGEFNVMVWSESLYYVPPSQIRATLSQYGQYLSNNGVQVIAISEALLVRYASTIGMIRANFQILEDHYYQGSGFEMIICR